MTFLPSKSWFSRFGTVRCLYLWNDTFCEGVTVLWPVDEKSLNKTLRRIKWLEKSEPDLTFKSRAMHFHNHVIGLHAIAISKPSFERRDISAVAHEAVHCANALLERRGMRASPSENDEPLAYMVQWIVREVSKHWKTT